MKIGIVGPSKEELMPLIEKLELNTKIDKAMLTFYQGKFHHIEVVGVCCGVCKVNAAIASQLLIDHFDVSSIILVGVAGGMDPKLKIGDVVVSTEMGYHDVDQAILMEEHLYLKTPYFMANLSLLEISQKVLDHFDCNYPVYFGRIITGESFIDQVGRQEIMDDHHPLCVDMETASVAQVCYVNGIPFIAIRAISDTKDESGIETFDRTVEVVSIRSIHFLRCMLMMMSERG